MYGSCCFAISNIIILQLVKITIFCSTVKFIAQGSFRSRPFYNARWQQRHIKFIALLQEWTSNTSHTHLLYGRHIILINSFYISRLLKSLQPRQNGCWDSIVPIDCAFSECIHFALFIILHIPYTSALQIVIQPVAGN